MTLLHLLRPIAPWLAVARLAGLAVVAPVAHGQVLTPWDSGTEALAAPWHFVGLPNQTKPRTQFSVQRLDDGNRALRVVADLSYGNLVHPLAGSNAAVLSWRWRVDEGAPRGDLRTREGDDVALKVCAMFDLPLDAVPFLERQALRVARMNSADPLPAATVCYVWDNQLPRETALDNAFSRRIRQIVLRGQGAASRQWFSEQRNLRQDFLRLFADEATVVPPLVAILIGADADNTKGRSLGHVMDLDLK